MRTNDERVQYKTHFFQLGQGRVIDITNSAYWSKFWDDPDSAADILELITIHDLRTIRDQNIANFLSLIYLVSKQVVNCVSDTKQFSKIKTLNYVRLLTKLIPLIQELETYSEVERSVFYAAYDPVKYAIKAPVASAGDFPEKEPLALQLIQALVDLLFLHGFTLNPETNKLNTKSLSVWEPGIGVNAKYQNPNLVVEATRTEIIKLILTLCGETLYQSPTQVVSQGSAFLTYLVTSIPKPQLLTLVCSLINVLCRAVRSAPEDSRLEYQNHSASVSRHLYITHCVQLLLAMVIYPLPPKNKWDIPQDKYYNLTRLYIGKLHKEPELLFLASSLINALRSPMNIMKNSESSKFSLNYYKVNPSSSLWTMEIIMFIWELLHCNKNMVRVIQDRFFAELNISVLFYITTHHSTPQYKNVVRLAAYFMLYLSHQTDMNECLFQPINQELLNSLPSSYRGNSSATTARDFLVISICTTLSTHIPGKITLTPLLTTTLVETLYNIIPTVSQVDSKGTNNPQLKLTNLNPRGGLSYLACSSITNLIVRFSSKTFILERAFHADLLALIIRAVCMASLRNPKSSRMLLFSLLKGEKIYDQAWNTIYGLKNEYFRGKVLQLNSIEDGDKREEDISPNDETSTSANSINSIQTPVTEARPAFYIDEELSNPSSPALSINQEEIEQESEIESIEISLRPKLPTGMSQKARDKHPMEAPISKTWGGIDALRIILTIIIPELKLCLNEIWSGQKGTSIDALELVNHIEKIDFDRILTEHRKEVNFDFLPTSPFVPLRFTWSHLALGWYTSLLYGDIYNAIVTVSAFTGGAGKIIKNLATSLSSFSKFTSWSGLGGESYNSSSLESESDILELEKSLTVVNQWAKTNIRLFTVEADNVSFFSAINNKISDSVNHTNSSPSADRPASLARRISDMRLGGLNNRAGTPPLTTAFENQDLDRRSSVTSLHSLNTLNRSRTATPRNSISM